MFGGVTGDTSRGFLLTVVISVIETLLQIIDQQAQRGPGNPCGMIQAL